MVFNKTSIVVGVLAWALLSGSTFLVPGAQAQGQGYALSDASSGLGQSTSQCAELGGQWSNSTGTCTVSGKGSVASGWSLQIDSGATLTIASGANFTNSGTINNDGGTLSNSGTLDNEGTLANNGTVTSTGEIVNAGTLTDYSGGIITNLGTLSNEAGGVVDNDHDFYNSGTVTNAGSFTNSCAGSLFDTGSFTGSPIVSCGTTSTFAQSTSTGTTVAKAANKAEDYALLALVTVVAVALLLWRGGVIKTSGSNAKKTK